jgi:subtilase family serine protease
MRIRQLSLAGLLASLCLCFTTPVSADSVFVGGPHRKGYARPSLRVFVNPAATAAATPYTPTQIRHAYGIDQLSTTGLGQKIAIVDAYGNQNIQSDLTKFCNQFGLKAANLQIIGNNPGGNGNGWDLETSLDVEWAHVVAPDATIILSVAASASDSDLLGAVDAAVAAGASVVSMSWGGTEWSTESAYDFHFNKANVTFVASSGDNGELASLPEVDWPAVSPYVVGVGGTSLYLDVNGNRIAGPSGPSETAWSSSGGGLSSDYSLPLWQAGWNTFASMRGVPDVSYVADPNTGLYVYCSTYQWPYVWWQVGGTSAGAPQWAALVALANQGRAAALSGNSDIYASTVAGSPGTISPANFIDISSGTNGTDADDISVVGYDLVTGLGSPLANNLVPALSGPPPQPPTTAPTVNATSGTGQVSLIWNSVSGATSYNVMRSTTPGKESTLITGVMTTSYTDKNVMAGTTYYYQVAGVNAGGPGPSSQEISATPTAPPDFSISASPASETVARGKQATYAVTITPSGGFTGSVSLSVSGLPSRSSASFSPSPVAVSSVSTSTLMVTTTSRTTTGTRTLTITATSGSLRHTQTVTLTVQ